MTILNFLKLFLKLFRIIVSKLINIKKFSLLNFIKEYTVKINKKPAILKDWAGFNYWQYFDDDIRHNLKRKSVTDGNHIIKYILSNINPGWTCVDIGGNIGAISIPLWSKVQPNGKVVTVEADPKNIDKIKANFKLNNCPDRYVVNVAITDKKGIVQLRCFPKCNGWQTLGNPAFAKNYKSFLVNVPGISFEDLAEIYSFRLIDFIKIDVEGAEILVLNGMRSFLKEKRIGCVIFETNHLTLEGMGNTVSQLISFWDEFDYALWRLSEDGNLIMFDINWFKNSVGDCIAFPRK